jgi:hypothetical protein
MRFASNVADRREQREHTLANLEDVSAEAFRKRFMEKVENGTLPDDNRTVEEIQVEEDATELLGFLSWCGIDEEVAGVDYNNPLESMSQISMQMAEGSKAALEIAASQRELNSEEDAAEKIKQVTEFTMNTDDPLLINEYKEKKEKIIQSLLAVSEKAERQKENEGSYRESASKDTSNRFQSKGSGYTYNFKNNGTSGSGSSSRERKIIDIEDEDEKRRAYYDYLYQDVDMAKKFAHDGGYYAKNETPPDYKKLFVGKKFRIKNLFTNIKKWFQTKQARVIVKFGIMVTFEMTMAVLAGKREFEGKGQMLAYLGMVMGAFVITNEMMKEGYDPRKFAFN